MENEVSGIAKLGIVLIALAVLIGLGFGIFQISKGTANSGVTDVQKELDGVSTSAFTTYDQTVITGTMVRSAVSDFEGENTAILIATQAWINYCGKTTSPLEQSSLTGNGSGFSGAYTTTNPVPIVPAYNGEGSSAAAYPMTPSDGTTALAVGTASFINYNTLIGAKSGAAGISAQKYTGDYYMAKINFDANCFRCTSGFLTDAGGKAMVNQVQKNLSKTGTTEFVPTGAKFQSYLIKDASGTIMGMAFQQIGQ